MQLTLTELILRTVPEGIILILAGYVFSKMKIDKNKILVSGIILGITTYLVRFLPVDFGVHTIIIIVANIILLVNINKINLFNAISSALLSMFTLVICDLANFYFIENILKISFDSLTSSILIKTLWGLPSLILYLVIIALMFYKNNNIKVREV